MTRITNEKTVEVQLKNVVPTTENSCTPTTKKRCINSTSINNTTNTKSNKLLLGGGDVPSPLPLSSFISILVLLLLYPSKFLLGGLVKFY